MYLNVNLVFICFVTLGIEYQKSLENIKIYSVPSYQNAIRKLEKLHNLISTLKQLLDDLNLKQYEFDYFGIHEKITAILGYNHVLSKLFFTFGYYHERYENFIQVTPKEYQKEHLQETFDEQIQIAAETSSIQYDLGSLELHLYAATYHYLPVEV